MTSRSPTLRSCVTPRVARDVPARKGTQPTRGIRETKMTPAPFLPSFGWWVDQAARVWWPLTLARVGVFGTSPLLRRLPGAAHCPARPRGR